MNPIRARLQSVVAGALEEAKRAAELQHPGSIGTAREILVERLVRPVVTPDVQFGTGHLVDTNAMLSGQLDVIIYSPLILPPGLFDLRTGLFPAESCLYAIEVKSRLSTSELRKSVDSASSVRHLSYKATQHHWRGNIVVRPSPPPIAALFAFSSDLKGDPAKEFLRLRKLQEGKGNLISVLCVVGRGYWFAGQGNNWHFLPASQEHDEVLNFMSGIANTIPQFLSAKGRPKFGPYFGNEVGGQTIAG